MNPSEIMSESSDISPGSPTNLSPSVSPTASSVSNASVPENVADFYGLDGTILHETIYNELMDIVMLMMQVGVGADRAHDFVYFVLSVYGMVTTDIYQIDTDNEVAEDKGGRQSEANRAVNYLDTLDQLIESLAKARVVDLDLHIGGVEAIMNRKEVEDAQVANAEDSTSGALNMMSPIRQVVRYPLVAAKTPLPMKPISRFAKNENGDGENSSGSNDNASETDMSTARFLDLDRIIHRKISNSEHTDNATQSSMVNYLNCATIRSHNKPIMCADMCLDTIVTGDSSHKLNVWNTTTLSKVVMLQLEETDDPRESVVSCCALGRSGTIVAGSYNRNLYVYKLPINRPQNQWKPSDIVLTERILRGHSDLSCVVLSEINYLFPLVLFQGHMTVLYVFGTRIVANALQNFFILNNRYTNPRQHEQIFRGRSFWTYFGR